MIKKKKTEWKASADGVEYLVLLLFKFFGKRKKKERKEGKRKKRWKKTKKRGQVKNIKLRNTETVRRPAGGGSKNKRRKA